MRKLAHIFYGFIFGLMWCGVAESLEISIDTVSSGNYNVNEDLTVQNGVLFEAHDIKANDSLRIFNYGQISGGMYICENCYVEIHNVGTFNATVTRATGASVIQIITTNSEVTDLGLASGFDVSVQNGVGLNFADVMQVASNADSIEIINTEFNAGLSGGFVAASNVKLSGNIVLRFDDVVTQPTLLFSNVSGNSDVSADSDALDSLHLLQTYWVNNDVFVRAVRSTDYAHILNNSVGNFLNDLRGAGADSKLFSKLDIAESIGEINDVLSQSFRTNPIKLMRPISIMYSQKMLENMHIADKGVSLEIEPLVIGSADLFMRGLRPNVMFNIDDLHFGVSAYFMDFDYSDDINEYSGTSFGIDANAQYDMSDNNFVRAHIGGGKSYFDVGPVFNNGTITNNPDGTSGFMLADFGHNFDFDGRYRLSPFVGFGAEYIGISGTSDTSFYGMGGTDIGYEYKMDGVLYGCSARGVVRTDGTFGAGVNLSMWSIIDAAGADMHLGTIYNNDFGLSWMLSLKGRFSF